MLIWARETAGYSLAAAARKIGIREEKLLAAEMGGDLLTFRQLGDAANVYKRSLALFYLTEPPARDKPIHDFRLDPDSANESISPAVTIAIRRARQRREEALELAQELSETVPPFTSMRLSTSDDVEDAATKVRKLVGGPAGTTQGWNSNEAALKARKAAIEALGVLVFETSRVSTAEMRGASLSFDHFPLMLLNGSDSHTGRSFTLMHELTHLLLHSSGVCDLAPAAGTSARARIEAFCNSVAAAVLMPSADVQALIRETAPREWSFEELSQLAKPFRVSREAMLIRLITLGRATEDYYWTLRGKFREEYLSFKEAQKNKKEGEEGGGPSPAVLAVRNLGKPFVRRVLDAYDGDHIGLATVSDYLGIKVRHLTRVRELVSTREAVA